MATLIGTIRLYGDHGSWIFEYGDRKYPTFRQKKFLVSEYGSLAAAKAAALKYWKDPARQKRLKENSPLGKVAKSYGYTYDEYQALPDTEKNKLRVVKRRSALMAGGEYETTFKVGGKKYTLPTYGFYEKRIPVLKSFLRSFNEWKNKGGNLEAYLNLKGRGKAFDRNQGHVWRLLIRYAQGMAPTRPGGSGAGESYKAIFDKLKIPKKELDTLKTFTQKTIDAAKASKASAASAAVKMGNPLVKPILNFVNKNPNATVEELFSTIRGTEGKNLTNSEIVQGVVRGHAQATARLLREGRGETIGESQLKTIKDFTSNQLRKSLGVLYNLFPNQIHREFGGTVEAFYKNNPTLQKKALRKLKDYNNIRRKVIRELELGQGPGRGTAAFQFDHPISFEALKRGGDLEGAIRTNPIAGDVNQFKRTLDIKLSEFQRRIIAGKDVEGTLSKIDTLKNINKTLFGKLAGDFTIDAKGKIKVLDYGAKTVLDPTYNIAKSLEANLPLGKQIKQTIGGIKPQLTEVLGESGAKTFMAEAGKLKTFFNSETRIVQRNIANALNCGRGEGGRIGYALGSATINCVNTKLTNEPVQSSMKLRVAEGVGKIRPAATSFLKLLGRGGVKAAPYAAIAAVGAVAEPLVKQFRNDDPSTYLSNPEQQKGMLLSMLEAETPKVDEEILKWKYPGEIGATAAGAIPGAKTLFQERRGVGPRGPLPGGVGKTRAALGISGVLGKALGASFSPLAVAATLPFDIAAQRKGGSDWGDIVTSPGNWMGPAFMGSGYNLASKGIVNPTLLKLLRFGISRGALAAMGPVGWAGLAGSLGLAGYDMWKNRDKDDEFKMRRYEDDD